MKPAALLLLVAPLFWWNGAWWWGGPAEGYSLDRNRFYETFQMLNGERWEIEVHRGGYPIVRVNQRLVPVRVYHDGYRVCHYVRHWTKMVRGVRVTELVFEVQWDALGGHTIHHRRGEVPQAPIF